MTDAPLSTPAPAAPPPAWVTTRWAYPALFVGSILESTVLPWPIELPLLAVMLRGRGHVFPAALVVWLGSAIGCVAAYWLGAAAFETAVRVLVPHAGEALETARAAAQDRGAPAVFVAMMTPVPVQITSVAAGAAGVGWLAFLIASATGRFVRYMSMAVVVFFAGERVMAWWRRRSGGVKAGTIVMLVVVFVAAVWMSLT